MKSICVFCGSSDAVHQEYKDAAFQTGVILAKNGIRVVYGGGKTGLMGAVADGALSSGGEVTGVIIPSMNTASLAHIGLTKMEVTPEMRSRKARMHELSDGFIALPGGFGTWDELFETVTWAQTGEHEKPVGLLNVRNYYTPLLAAIDHAVAEGFVFAEHRQAIAFEAEPMKLLESMRKYEHPHDAVKRWMKEE
ncbi:MAG: TIGR00730 family Rossman fold protein [Anaerolineales bacterium]|nr:TIGR00730 family Rossman fold protein [Anaerolineales bacterium]MCB9146900.1 TIGR00730 family Rossman fold protein [Anaerolineales bacterium]